MSAQPVPSTPVRQPPPPPSPELNALIVAEFTYVANSTNHSSEDRARVSNYYLVTLGAAIAAIFSERLINATQPSVYAAIGIGLIALGLLGVFTLLTLIRLRAGWLDGVAAMNQIKSYYEWIYPNAKLAKAFIWNKVPSAAKSDSVAFWTAASVIIVDSAALGLGGVFLIAFQTRQFMDETSLLAGSCVLVITVIIQLVLYNRLLTRAGQKVHAHIQSTATRS